MNVNDYLIDQAGKDWQQLLCRWTPPLPEDFTIWLVNRLGELIIINNGAVHWLVAGEGQLVKVADSQQHFAQLLDNGSNAERWLRLSLVNDCRRAGMTLADNECYGFKIPPILQGQYEVANLKPTPLDQHYSLLAHLHKQEEIYWTA